MTDIPDVNDGNWHGHNGGPMPEGVHNDSIVDLRWAHAANGNDCVTARGWHWSKVCAYRVTTAHVEPPKPREWWIKNGCLVNLDGSLIRSGLGSETPDEAFRGIHVREVLE
jgi:hypothetical protein